MKWAWRLIQTSVTVSILTASLFTESQAAQIAQIDTDEAALVRTPSETAEVIARPKKGEYAVVSNYPYEGFYKARLKSGEVGFLNTQSVFVIRDPEILKRFVKKTPEQRSVMRDHTAEAPSFEHQKQKTDYKKRPIHLSLFGGMTLFTWPEFLEATSVTNYSNGYHFGMEGFIPIGEKLSAVVRIEKFTFTFNIRDSFNAITHNLESGSLPLLLGLGYSLGSEKFKIHFAGLVGAGFDTYFSSIETALGSDNTTRYSGIAFAWMAKAEVAYTISKSVSAFLEFGYRWLKTGSMTATTTSLTGNTYISGGATALVLNYSGFFFSGGVAFYF